MEEVQHVSSIEKPSFATSQVCIDAGHGEMTLLVCEEKVKFDLHQSILLTDEERRVCMKIESSFTPIKEHAPMFLQEDTLECFELEALWNIAFLLGPNSIFWNNHLEQCPRK